MPTNITICGNACANPEERTANSGTKIVELRIASNEGKDKTVFWTAKFFGNKAGEVVLKYVKTGSSVMVSGSVDEETWEAKDGQKKSKMICVANGFNFLGGKSENKDEAAKSAVKTKGPIQDSGNEQDVPF